MQWNACVSGMKVAVMKVAQGQLKQDCTMLAGVVYSNASLDLLYSLACTKLTRWSRLRLLQGAYLSQVDGCTIAQLATKLPKLMTTIAVCCSLRARQKPVATEVLHKVGILDLTCATDVGERTCARYERQ